MRKIGMMLALLSLVAMTPSYGKNGDACRQSDRIGESVEFVDNSYTGGGSDGSRSRPYTDIAKAVQKGGEGCAIYVRATESPYTLEKTVVLKEGQLLIGSCVGLKIEGREIAALTKTPPLVRVAVRDAPGIEVGTANKVVGFSFEGTRGAEMAIGSSGAGVGKSCAINKNLFSNFEFSVYLTAEPHTELEFEGNRFTQGIFLFTNDGVDARVCNNHFTDWGGFALVSFPASTDKEFVQRIETSHRAGVRGHRPYPTKVELLTRNEFVKKVPRFKRTSSASKLLIENNTFESAPTATGIYLFDEPSHRVAVQVLGNNFSNVGAAFLATSLQEMTFNDNFFDTAGVVTLSGNKIGAKGNLFKATSLVTQLSGGGAAHLEQNTFSNTRDEAGLGVELRDGATACVEKNRFFDNEIALSVWGSEGSSSSSPNCLQLVGNFAKDNGTDFQIDNRADSELFEAAIYKNKGAVTFAGNEITPVLRCSGCAQSK